MRPETSSWWCSALVIGACSCSAQGLPSPAGDANETHDEEATTEARTVTTESHEAGTGVARDAGSAAESNAQSSSDAFSGGTSALSLGTGPIPTTTDLDASVILEPEVEEMSLLRLCNEIAYLEGESVDVDLTGEVSSGDWLTVSAGLPSGDAAIDGDAEVCDERFAAYVAACGGSFLVLSAPTLAFGEGPIVGGEHLGVGCWQQDCNERCLPEATDAVGKVRVRVSAPLSPRYDAELGVTVGEIRINGVDIEGVALLEILARK